VDTVGPFLSNLGKPILVGLRFSNLNHTVLEAETTDRGHVSIPLGKLLGQGWAGAVYEVGPATGGAGDSWRQGLGNAELVAKIGHSNRTSSSPAALPRKNQIVKMEANELTLMYERVDAIQADPEFPKAYLPGKLPIANIIREFTTDLGTILIKPWVRGLSMKDIKSRGGLTPEMKASLRDIYFTYQAIHRNVQSVAPTRAGYKNPENRLSAHSIDLQPGNLIWVDDPAQHSKLGLKNPGFVLVDAGQLVGNDPAYIPSRMSFERYVGIVETYISSQR
jgi:hypothetical protein